MSKVCFTGHVIVHVMCDPDSNGGSTIVDLELLHNGLSVAMPGVNVDDDLGFAADQLMDELNSGKVAVSDGDYVVISVMGHLSWYQSGWEYPEWDLEVDYDEPDFCVMTDSERKLTDLELKIPDADGIRPNDYHVEVVAGNAIIIPGAPQTMEQLK